MEDPKAGEGMKAKRSDDEQEVEGHRLVGRSEDKESEGEGIRIARNEDDGPEGDGEGVRAF